MNIYTQAFTMFWASFVGLIISSTLRANDEPEALHLTWQNDTSTTMTVNFITSSPISQSEVLYDVVSRQSDAAAYGSKANGESHFIKGLESGPQVHWVELTGLDPGQTYYFVAGSPESGYSRERKFRTIPRDGSPLRFVTGGDMGVGDEVPELLRHAAAREPDFAVIGGDIAYGNGKLENLDRWNDWTKHWTEGMVTPEGFTVPVGLAIGNHEVDGSYGGTKDDAPFYFGLFAQESERSYFRRKFGKNLVFYFLDSGHITSHESQRDWLEERLTGDRKIRHRMAVYHVPQYPGHRAYEGDRSTEGRLFWGPIFDKHGIRVAFENHDHVFKRSHLIRGGKIAEDGEGVIYLGDGAWGQGPRAISVSPRWYLDKVSSTLHFWSVEVRRKEVVYRAVDKEGREFDVYPESAEGALEAEEYFATLKQEYELREDWLEIEPLLSEERMFRRAVVVLEAENRESVPLEAHFRIEASDSLKVKPTEGHLRLQPGESGTLEFALGSVAALPIEEAPGAILEFEVECALPDRTVKLDGKKLIRVEKLRTVEYADQEMEIDGKLEDWGELPYRFENPQGFEPEERIKQWRGQLDASCRFGVQYDERFLYVAFSVMDSSIQLSSGRDLRGYDGLVFWADVYPGGKGDDDPMFALSPGEGSANTNYWDIEDTPKGTKVAALVSAIGYDAEIALPLGFFETLREERGGGELEFVRLNFALNDRDEKEENALTLFWRPEWEDMKDYLWSGVFRLE